MCRKGKHGLSSESAKLGMQSLGGQRGLSGGLSLCLRVVHDCVAVKPSRNQNRTASTIIVVSCGKTVESHDSITAAIHMLLG